MSFEFLGGEKIFLSPICLGMIKNNHISVIIQDWLGNTLYTVNQENIFSQLINCVIPETVFELWVFDFESDTFSTRSGLKTNVKKWLE